MTPAQAAAGMQPERWRRIEAIFDRVIEVGAAEREQVLERFYRITGTAGTGSGLGLSIVREIAVAHGARMEIASGEGGRGCKVGLTFPNG